MINYPGLVLSPYFYTPDPAIKAFLIPEGARNLQLFHMVSFRGGERPLTGVWRLKKKKPKAKQKDKCQNKQEQIPESHTAPLVFTPADTRWAGAYRNQHNSSHTSPTTSNPSKLESSPARLPPQNGTQ